MPVPNCPSRLMACTLALAMGLPPASVTVPVRVMRMRFSRRSVAWGALPFTGVAAVGDREPGGVGALVAGGREGVEVAVVGAGGGGDGVGAVVVGLGAIDHGAGGRVGGAVRADAEAGGGVARIGAGDVAGDQD